MCRLCLAASIEHSDAPKVKCPFKDENYSCDMEILEREIKAVRDARRKKGKKLSHFQNYISHHPSHQGVNTPCFTYLLSSPGPNPQIPNPGNLG